MLVMNHFDLTREGMLAAAIAAPIFAVAVYYGGDRIKFFQTRHLERPLEQKIGDALGVTHQAVIKRYGRGGGR